jgi:hypothetical protein
MIAAFVTFQLDDTFDADLLSKIADEVQSMFVGMPQLRNKVFTIDESNRRAVNFYVWENEGAARAFFNDALIERVTNLYGVKPQLDFAEVAALVDNSK